MKLTTIKKEELLFSGEIADTCTNTYVHLSDYDWMNYIIKTKFKTKTLGTLDIFFEYFGGTKSTMTISQVINDGITVHRYEYPTEIFKKYMVMFLEKHIRNWNEDVAFDGEDEVLSFYNEIIETGELTNDKE